MGKMAPADCLPINGPFSAFFSMHGFAKPLSFSLPHSSLHAGRARGIIYSVSR